MFLHLTGMQCTTASDHLPMSTLHCNGSIRRPSESRCFARCNTLRRHSSIRAIRPVSQAGGGSTGAPSRTSCEFVRCRRAVEPWFCCEWNPGGFASARHGLGGSGSTGRKGGKPGRKWLGHWRCARRAIHAVLGLSNSSKLFTRPSRVEERDRMSRSLRCTGSNAQF